ncbi:hypothetical protein KKB40_06110 [Patescibacteria group bacterium]|nr:hypothetical protein [Patescibacteria group bacterium]
MACFLVATVFGIIMTVFRKKFPRQWHINWLIVMIFGGAIALAVEHIAHQEIVPWLPFLTAMSNPADTAAMLGEMTTVGIPMAVALVVGWIAMVVVYEKVVAIRTTPMSASGA